MQDHVIQADRLFSSKRLLGVIIFLLAAIVSPASAEPDPPATASKLPPPLSLARSLVPYRGESEKGVDCSTLHGKVMCGYQGWFTAKDDGYGMGDTHWGGVNRSPPSCIVDLWPDLSECDPEEKFPTQYKLADGSPAFVFSSTVAKTVHRHFRWMKDYGIDGAFVQRFDDYVFDQNGRNYQRACAVLHHAREGANRNGRAYALMYDMHFDRRGLAAIRADWRRLLSEMQITKDPAYLHHGGRPVLALWGYGFEERGFSAGDVESLLQFLRSPEGGGCTLILGVNNDWRTKGGQPLLLAEKYAQIISPWNVGRYRDGASARRFFAQHWTSDLAWCKEHGKEYYPVAFPGFSWHNLRRGRAPLDEIPRRKGEFFQLQIDEIRRYGMDMAYLAMFDEIDEGTALFKCTNQPPAGSFVTLEGLPSDAYLKLAGQAGKTLRGEKPAPQSP